MNGTDAYGQPIVEKGPYTAAILLAVAFNLFLLFNFTALCFSKLGINDFLDNLVALFFGEGPNLFILTLGN